MNLDGQTISQECNEQIRMAVNHPRVVDGGSEVRESVAANKIAVRWTKSLRCSPQDQMVGIALFSSISRIRYGLSFPDMKWERIDYSTGQTARTRRWLRWLRGATPFFFFERSTGVVERMRGFRGRKKITGGEEERRGTDERKRGGERVRWGVKLMRGRGVEL